MSTWYRPRYSPVASIDAMSCGCSTTQMRPASRRGSLQRAHGSVAVSVQQIEQRRISCGSASIAEAISAATCGS